MEQASQVSIVSTTLPTVSVLVLNHNGLEHLGPCFASLRELEYPSDKLELMLVDNDSSDGSIEYVQARFPTVRIVHHPENYGVSKGNNLGAREASSRLVAFLNNDMRVDRRWLIELVQPLLRDSDVVCAASKILRWHGQRIDYAGALMNVLGYGYQEGWGEPPTMHDREKFTLAPCGGAMLVDREVFLESGGFDEHYFSFYEDLDLGWRFWVLGYKVVYVPRAVVFHVHHGSWRGVPDEKKAVLYQRNAFSTLFKNYSDEDLSRILPVALLLYLRRAYLATEVDASRFRCESPAIAPHLHAEAPRAEAPPQLSVLAPVADRQTRNSAYYYLHEIWRTLRHKGPVHLWCKVITEIERRWRERPRRGLSFGRQVQQQARPGYTLIARQAVSHLIAADDLVRGLDHLMQERHTVQRHRCRSDEEIRPLFGSPFESDYPNPHYTRTMGDIVAACGLRDLFFAGET